MFADNASDFPACANEMYVPLEGDEYAIRWLEPYVLEIQEILDDRAQNQIRRNWRIGGVLRFCGSELSRRPGSERIDVELCEFLAARVNVDARTLDACWNVYECCSQVAIEILAQAQYITWEHVALIFDRVDHEQWMNWIRRLYDNEWSVHALEEALDAAELRNEPAGYRWPRIMSEEASIARAAKALGSLLLVYESRELQSALNGLLGQLFFRLHEIDEKRVPEYARLRERAEYIANSVGGFASAFRERAKPDLEGHESSGQA